MGSQDGDMVSFLGPGTYFTMPYPKLTMITRRRASVLLIADINSAKISKLWAEGGRRKIIRPGSIWTPAAKSLNAYCVQLRPDLRRIRHVEFKGHLIQVMFETSMKGILIGSTGHSSLTSTGNPSPRAPLCSYSSP